MLECSQASSLIALRYHDMFLEGAAHSEMAPGVD
jgi:hypothetical protein